MTTFLGYLLIIVGLGVSIFGYAGARFPQVFKDEARQAFWGAIGIYVFLLGGVIMIFGAHVISS